MAKLLDLTGKKFGRLTVVCRDGRKIYGKSRQNSVTTWQCLCDCGTQVCDVNAINLTTGGKRSCGCIPRAKKKSLDQIDAARNLKLEYYKKAIKLRNEGFSDSMIANKWNNENLPPMPGTEDFEWRARDVYRLRLRFRK